MQLNSGLALVLVALLCGQSAGQKSPIDKVVTLLEEMKGTVAKEAKADEEAYEKYACWCTTGRAEKTEAVADAEKRIAALEAFLENAAGTEAQLKNEIEGLADDIAQDQDSLDTATGVRTKEEGEFKVTSADMMECIGSLKEAVAVLKKVQLVQHDKTQSKPLLLQLKHVITAAQPRINKFRSAMQKDLWEVLGSLGLEEGIDGSARKMRGSQSMSALEQPSAGGAAAGAKSYNSRSGSIFGMIDAMKDEFESDLGSAQKAELEAEIQYQHLKAAKLAEMHAATTQKTQKEKALAETKAKAAEAKEDMESTNEQMSADEQILLGLEKNCKTEEEEYKKRVKVRSEEAVAIAETIGILTDDETRELFGKTLSFFQIDSSAVAQRRALDKAVKHILSAARKNKDWALASLAVRAKLDGFEKVKEAMDKMTAELQTQMKEETEKYRFCTTEIDETEDTIKVKNQEKEDLSEQKLNLENTIATLKSEIDTLSTEDKDEMVSLKKAGEDRKAENLLYQQSIADQRATAFVLKKALTRLEDFYVKKGFMQTGSKLDPPPAKPSSTQYEKSGSSGGAMQMLQKIISEAEQAESELLIDEKNAQENFATFTRETMAAIEAKRIGITEKTKLEEEAAADLANTEEALATNSEVLKSLGGVLAGLHGDCDYIVKYYDLRQKSRQEEIDAIAEAKAILSGADFGF